MPRKPRTTTPAAGHNSLDRDKLRDIVQRIEVVEDERIVLAEDLRGLYQEAHLASAAPRSAKSFAFAGRITASAMPGRRPKRRGASMPMWKSVTLNAGLLAVATGFAAAASVTVRSDVAVRAGPGANFSAIGYASSGTELETTDCAGGWCRVEFNGIAGFVGVADLGNDAAIGSSSATRAGNRERGRARVERRPAPAHSAPRAVPAGEDADLFVLPAQSPATPPLTRH